MSTPKPRSAEAPATPDATPTEGAAPSAPCTCAGKACPCCDGTLACPVCGGACELCNGTGVCPARPAESAPADAPADAAPGATAVAVPGGLAARAAEGDRLRAALAEATGKRDVEGQLGALGVLVAKARAHDEALTRAARAEEALRDAALERLIAEGRAAGKLTPAQAAKAEGDRPAGWARRQSPEALEAFLADAPVVIPRGEHRGPTAPPTADPQLPVEIAGYVAKARASGWLSLAATERHAVMAHDADLARRLNDSAR